MEAVEVEILIAEVQKRLPIYDTSIKEYYDLNEKNKLWKQICKIVYSPAVWEGLPANEKSKYGKYLQKKWATLRRGFRRELALQKSNPPGSSAKKRKKYIYFDSLRFLMPFTSLTCNETLEEEDSYNLRLNSEDSLERPVSVTDESLLQIPSSINEDSLQEGDPQVYVTNNLLEVERTTSNKTDDDDEAFFKSLLPGLRELTTDEKFLLRIEIMKTILNFKRSLHYIRTPRYERNFANDPLIERKFSPNNSD